MEFHRVDPNNPKEVAAFEALWAETEADREKRAATMPTEQDAINALWQAYQRLKELGWNDACYAPQGELVNLVECGSTGIHTGYKDEKQRHWVESDHDLWPSHPVLFKKKGI